MEVQNNRKSLSSNKKYRCLLLTGAYLVFNLLLIFIGNPRYEVSDDFMMELIASGTYGTPDGHIMFSNTAYGSILAGLYSLLPSINWYYGIQTIITLLSGCIMVYLLAEKVEDLFNGFLMTIIFTLFSSQDLFILPQFTKTAAITVVTGGILFIRSVFEEKRKGMMTGLLLGMIGSMIRYMAVYIAGPFLVLYFISRMKLEKGIETKQILIRRALPVAVAFLILFGLHGLQSLTYAKDEYRQYQDFSNVRASVVDYPLPDYHEIEKELSSIGISENDYSMIRNWMFDDKDVFSLEKMRDLEKVLEGYRGSHRKTLISALGSIYRRGQIAYPIAIGCMIAGALCIFSNWKKWYVPVICVLLLAAFFIHFALQGRTVYRIEFACFISALTVILMQYRTVRFNRIAGFVTAGLILASICMNCSSYVFPDDTEAMSRKEYMDYIDDTFYYSWNYDSDKYIKVIRNGEIRPDFITEVKEGRNNIYLLEFPTCIQTFYYDFRIDDSTAYAFPENAVYLGGVAAYHPVMNHLLEDKGYGSWLESLLEEDVYFVGNKMQDVLLTYYSEHGYEGVTMELLREVDGYKIWKYHRA